MAVKADTTHLNDLYSALNRELDRAKEEKTFKYEVPLDGHQGGVVTVDGKQCVMLASNNYLGLANHPVVVAAARKGLDQYGFGLASVRFICGTQPLHRQLEEKIASFLGTEDSILFTSCWAANEGFFNAMLGTDLGYKDYRDMIYSDQLNHASIIDGVRLARIAVKTTDARAYKHNNVSELSAWMDEDAAKNHRFKIVATDGVFSMEGDVGPLPQLVELTQKHNAMLFVDESHSTGVLGKTGRGTPEELGVHGKIDVISGTLGKALGGAAGGFVTGRRSVVDFLRQKCRPYTFSNSLPPFIASAALAAFDLLEKDTSLVEKLHDNTAYFRKQIVSLGFKILEGVHPIVPVMLGEAPVAMDMSKELLELGVYVRGLWYPVVPRGEARLRVQISAAHSREDLDRALDAFEKAGKKLKVI
ncbi:MAG: glycine C-acetyltransferase [Candidatus Obscuribacterales bacterium]|nr:glycine C-acetyltransferase [Candidatus Obscuribacterales bacterium]